MRSRAATSSSTGTSSREIASRTLDLATNLRWYRSRYQRILAARPPDEGPSLRGDRERTVRRRYYAYVQAKLQEVEAALARIGRLSLVDPEAPAGTRGSGRH